MPDLVSLLSSQSSNDLKNLVKERGLARSGTKPVLARRLAEADPEGMTHLFRGMTYLACTPGGLELVDQFLEAGVKAEQEARDRSMAALRGGQYGEACRVVASFEATRVFGRGLGIDWHNYESARDEAILRLVFSERLARHTNFDENAIKMIQVAAAMMQIWGTNDPQTYLDRGLKDDEIDWAVETRMLLFRAIETVRRQELEASGIQRVEVLGSGNQTDCQVCKSDNKKEYPIGQAPLLPHEGCSCQAGCRCILLAAE